MRVQHRALKNVLSTLDVPYVMLHVTCMQQLDTSLSSGSYDAVAFDLLTALLDSWTVWNKAAGSEADGLRWRRSYLRLTYGCGAYRPYEDLVREAASEAGLGDTEATQLTVLWGELQPWSDVARCPWGFGSTRPALRRRDELLRSAGPAGRRLRGRSVRGDRHGGRSRLLQAAGGALQGAAGQARHRPGAHVVRRGLARRHPRRNAASACRCSGTTAPACPSWRTRRVPLLIADTLHPLADLAR